MAKNKRIKPEQTEKSTLNKEGLESFRMDKTTLNSSISYLILFVVLVIIYIANAHYHIKTMRQIKNTQNELKEIQAEYVSLKAELAKRTKASEMAKGLKDQEIKELRQPPYRVKKEK